MEVVIPDASYPENEWNETARQEFFDELALELGELSEEYTLADTDIGRGADWPAVLVSFGVAATIFFSGKRIEENLDAWINLAKRFRAFIDKATSKWRTTRVDEEVALLLVLEEVIRQRTQGVSVLQLDGVLSSWFDPLEPYGKPPERLDCHPEGLYVVALRVDDESLYIVGIKSSGTIEFVHTFSTNWWDF